MFANHVCRGVKKNGQRCGYFCQDNFMCKIHAGQAVQHDCAICHEVIKHPFNKTTPCGHMFHTECYEKWHDTPHGDTCPLCRGPLKKMNIETMLSIIDDVREVRSMYMDFIPAYEAFKLKKNEMTAKIDAVIKNIHSKMFSDSPSITCKRILNKNVMNLLDLQHHGILNLN